jgi:hypothetical protein
MLHQKLENRKKKMSVAHYTPEHTISVLWYPAVVGLPAYLIPSF